LDLDLLKTHIIWTIDEIHSGYKHKKLFKKTSINDLCNATNSNETSNKTCLEEIISNVEFDDIDNSDNMLEQFEEENII
ncbi:15572_t:CDS:2, partial [Gigaspora margarita]